MPVHFHRSLVLPLVTLAFYASAWSQTENKQEPLGEIYVYANWESPQRKWVDIACDDKIVAQVKAGRFFVINVPPGRHALTERDGIPAFIDLHSGEKSYVRLDREVDGQTVMPVLTRMSPAEAEKEMVHLAYIDPAKAFSNSVPEEDPRDVGQRHPQLKTRGSEVRNSGIEPPSWKFPDTAVPISKRAQLPQARRQLKRYP